MYLAEMCPQWLAVVSSTDHHSDKIATTTNSQTSTTISKKLNLNCQLLYIHNTYIPTYVVSTRNVLGIS